MTRRLRVWSFSLGERDSVAQQVRLVGPLGLLPQDKFEYVYAPSWRAALKLGQPPDVAVFHRNFYPLRESRRILAALRARGGKAVLDLDDLITEVPADHSSAAAYRPLAAEAEDLIRAVDAVTVTTPRLRERYAALNPKIHVLPNLLDERIWGPPVPASRCRGPECVIGYAGAPDHSRDWALVEPALRHVLSKYRGKVSLVTVGSAPAGVRGLPGVKHLPLIPLYRDYARALKGCLLDVAVIPLKDEAFNSCKSNIKFLEFSACGAAGVFSDVGPYRDSIEDGKTGLLAKNTTDAWVAALERLIEDPNLRARLGDAACRHVWKEYALSEKATLWAELYERLAPSPRGGASLSPYFSYGPYLAYSLLRGRA